MADTFTPPPYGETINLETAKKVAAGAAAEAAKRKWDGFCIAVVGPSGDLVYFEKMDNCQYASITISQHKARTAARYRRPTLAFENLIGKGPYFNYLTTLDDVIASRGGNPLMVGGKVVGAIGVSGGSGAQDDTLSQAGVAVLRVRRFLEAPPRIEPPRTTVPVRRSCAAPDRSGRPSAES